MDHVLFSDSSIKAATNARQWYVTISRGRRGVRIFTTDKERLQENVKRTGQNELALDLARGKAQSIIAAHRKRLHLGYGTLQAVVKELAQEFRVFRGIREPVIPQKQSTPSIRP